MKDLFIQDFGARRLMIGMVHTPGLPGSPRYDRDGGMRKVIAQALDDANALADAGFHALLYCNEADMPYETQLRAETVSAMTAVIMAVQSQVRMPFGVNMLIDPAASIAIAHATGGRFVRAFLTGGYVGDFGVYATEGADIMRRRANIGAGDVRVMANVTPGFSVPSVDRPLTDVAKGAVFIGLADAVVVGGSAAGVEVDLAPLQAVAAATPDTPLVVGTGAAVENVAKLMTVADGFIVGSSIKIDRKTLNPIDPARARAFMEEVRLNS
jgi:membrane complex biogenesis BtpA family protein